MNPFKKLKLKSQLRNCDYVLAGTVIKQQYYDSSKSTVINRLIDEYMENPCFDTALALIEYNEMMVFYFTESCDGGLYVRKTSQDHKRTDHSEHGYHADSNSNEDFAASDDPYSDSSHLDSDIPTLEQLEEVRRRDAFDLSADSLDPSDDPLFDTKRIRREEKHRKILQESEEWMEQLLSAREPRTKKYPHSKREYEKQFFSDTANEEAQQKTDMVTYTEQEDNVPSATDLLHDPQDTIQFTPILEAEPEPAATSVTEPEPAAIQEADQQAPAALAAEQEVAATLESEPEFDLSRTRSMKPKKSYPNVIATLKIDIHTMAKQLEDYRQQLSYQPFNEKQLIAWIKSLEEAIEEFSEVVDLLEDDN